MTLLGHYYFSKNIIIAILFALITLLVIWCHSLEVKIFNLNNDIMVINKQLDINDMRIRRGEDNDITFEKFRDILYNEIITKGICNEQK